MIEHTSSGLFFVSGNWPLDNAKPTIVFIHGSGGSHVLWDKQVSALSPYANTIALDLPGHGKSQGDAKDNIKDISSNVHQFIESLNVSRPILCGLSIGGAIALQLLIEKRVDYQGGILINTGARLKVMPGLIETLKTDYPAAVEATKVFAISEKTDPLTVEPLIEEMRKCRVQSTVNDFLACDSFNVMDKLNRIDTPVLVLTAADDKLTPPKYGKYLAENIPQSTFVQIHDAGHLSPFEKEAEVNQAIIAFINSVHPRVTLGQ